MNPFDELALTTTCGRCKACPGDRCVTRTGHTSTIPHAARSNPIYDAWRIGFEEGRRDQQATIDNLMEPLLDSLSAVAATALRDRLNRARRYL